MSSSLTAAPISHSTYVNKSKLSQHTTVTLNGKKYILEAKRVKNGREKCSRID